MPGRVSTSAALENTKCCFGSFFDAMSGTESDSHSSSVGMQDISPRGPTLKDGYDAMLLRTCLRVSRSGCFAANLNCRGSLLVGSMKPGIASPASSNRDFEQFPHDFGSKGRIIRNSYVTVHRDAIPSFKPWNQEPTQPRVH